MFDFLPGKKWEKEKARIRLLKSSLTSLGEIPSGTDVFDYAVKFLNITSKFQDNGYPILCKQYKTIAQCNWKALSLTKQKMIRRLINNKIFISLLILNTQYSILILLPFWCTCLPNLIQNNYYLSNNIFLHYVQILMDNIQYVFLHLQ